MKRFCFNIITILILYSVLLVAQTNGGYGSVLPSNCTIGSIFVKSGSSPGGYYCSATDIWTAIGGSGGASAWGDITGTLSNQTDLQTALNGKANSLTSDENYVTDAQLVVIGNTSGTNTGNQTITLTGNVTGTGTGSFATTITAGVVTEAMQVLADNTTNDVSTTKHGYVPKLPNNAAQFLNGVGAFATPAGSTTLQTINIQALTSSPTDSQTIYFGQLPKAPVTTQGTSRIYIRRAGTIRQVQILNFSGTAGTNENWTCNIRLNNTGDTAIATVGLATSERVWFNANLNLAVTTSDYIEVKCVNPAWATNPLTSIFGGYLLIEG